MRKLGNNWILSPRDLIAELECNHRLNLEWSAITGLIAKPKEENDAAIQLVIDNGIAHEQRLDCSSSGANDTRKNFLNLE